MHDDGTLLEYETLELRLHPPNVMVDNETYEDVTVVTIDSANRPGTLIEVRHTLMHTNWESARTCERNADSLSQVSLSLVLTLSLFSACQVVQTLTELNLSIRKARISSDGGWFVDGECSAPVPICALLTPEEQTRLDVPTLLCLFVCHSLLINSLFATEFFVTETPRGKVTDARKLNLIKQVSELLLVDASSPAIPLQTACLLCLTQRTSNRQVAPCAPSSLGPECATD